MYIEQKQLQFITEFQCFAFRTLPCHLAQDPFLFSTSGSFRLLDAVCCGELTVVLLSVLFPFLTLVKYFHLAVNSFMEKAQQYEKLP